MSKLYVIEAQFNNKPQWVPIRAFRSRKEWEREWRIIDRTPQTEATSLRRWTTTIPKFKRGGAR